MTPLLGERSVALAFIPPALLGIVVVVVVVVVAALMGHDFLRAVREGGVLGLAALFTALVSTGIVSAVRGLGIARPVALAAAASSWIVASIGALLSLNAIGDVLTSVDAHHRAPLFWAGYAESLGARVVVAPIAASSFAGAALSALLRARGRAGREERWRMLALAALAALAVAGAGAGLAAVAASEASSLRQALLALASASSSGAPPLNAAHMNADRAQLASTLGLFVAAVGVNSVAAASDPLRLRVAFDERAAVAPVLAVARDVGVSRIEMLVHAASIGCATSTSTCVDATALRAGEVVKTLEAGSPPMPMRVNIGPPR